MKFLRVCLATSLAVLATQAFALTAKPPEPTTCIAEASAAWNDGYSAGIGQGNAQGFNAGFSDGYGSGADDGAAWCRGNPAACGLTLSACLPPPQYGETEPNDNLVTADGLPFDVNFWGQSYGAADEDWFYIVTTQANQNLSINFSVPNGTPAGWKIAIRDSAGNLFADFDTSVPGGIPTPAGDVAYRVTLGFPGTYYLVVQTSGADYFGTYNLAAVLQASPLDAPNFVVGFYDVELEPNDFPGQSTWLTTGVTMYGVINLTFDETVPTSDGTREWAQGEWDWYAYYNTGSEVVTLTFCGRDKCEPGEWLAEVYDFNGANTVAAGGEAPAILALNTNNTSSAAPLTYKFGLPKAEIYYLRVNHKRLYTAPCVAYRIDTDNNGIEDGGACRCASGQSCDIKIVIPKSQGTCRPGTPGTPSGATGTTGATPAEYFCPDGERATEVSQVPPPATVDQCTRGDMQCGVSCLCTAFGGVVEVPEGAVTSQYNFTWNATKLPPNTYATDAYQDFQGRPSPY